MKLDRLRTFAQQAVSLDTETHLSQPGLRAPPLVCGSLAWLDLEVHHLITVRDDARTASQHAHLAGNDRQAFELDKQAEALTTEIGSRTAIPGQIMSKYAIAEAFAEVIEDPTRILVGANIAYDLTVIAVHLARLGIDVMPAILRAFIEGRVYDVQIAEALHAVAEGHLDKDPRTGGPLINPETGRRGRYALATLVDLVLGRMDAKANDEWRTKYALLDGKPMIEWPQSALVYPVDDARNTHEVALAQLGIVPKVAPHHHWVPPGVCGNCGTRSLSAPCWIRAPHRNLHEVADQTFTAFALQLGAAWGFRVNQASVDAVEAYALDGRAEAEQPFVAAGFIRADGTEDRAALKRAIAQAYGATQPCAVCNGTGKVKSRAKSGGQITCCTFDPADPSPGAAKLKTCDGTGYELPGGVPRADKDGVSFGRDVKNESGDELLMALAEHQEDAKVLNVYVPYLRTARRVRDDVQASMIDLARMVDGDGNPVAWVDIPLTLWPNTILETGRVSYGGVIQLFPRAGGVIVRRADGTEHYVPSLRECIEARPRYIFSSEDFESGELFTHGQSCIWITGDSVLARALLTDVKPHNALAATLLGMRYEDYNAKLKLKDPTCVDTRTAAKWGNFGYPGGMGIVKMVLTCRRQGPDTPHATGTHCVDDGNGHLVPGYKGLRFCILMDGASYCGRDKKVTEYGQRAIPPTCRQCIECAKRLREGYYRQWPEVNEKASPGKVPYFTYVNQCIDEGMTITGEMLDRWPHLQGWYHAGQQLAPGEIMQHVSGRIRGGLEYSACANGFFQGLLADISKAALRRVVRECYDPGVRITLAHANSRRSRFDGGPSPLLGSRAIGFFHDELLMEHPEGVAHEGAMRVSEIMEEEMAWYLPDLASKCKAEPTLMRRWYKGAVPLYAIGKEGKDGKVDRSQPANDHDRLVPWEPKPMRLAA